MYSSRSSKLKFSNKRNQWENSSQSLTISENHGIFWAYSYNEKILDYDSKLKKYIFNYYRFSNTTNKHQSIIRDFIENRHSIKNNIIFVEMNSLNRGFIYEKLEVSQYNLEVVKTYFKKHLKDFEKRLEEKNKSKKISDSKKRYENLVYSKKIETKKQFNNMIEFLSKNETSIQTSISDLKDLSNKGFDIKNHLLKEFHFSISGLWSSYFKSEADFLDSIGLSKIVEDKIKYNGITVENFEENNFSDSTKEYLKEYFSKKSMNDLAS